MSHLGDDNEIPFEELNSYEEVEAYIRKKFDVCVILPVYVFQHGNIALSTNDFNDRWDSGQCGFIYCTKAKAREEYGRLTKKAIGKVEDYLKGEVEMQSNYANGDVYGYQVIDNDDITGCGGFFATGRGRRQQE